MIKQFTYFTEEPDLTEGNTATPSTITDGPEDSAEVPALSPLLNEIEGSTLPVFISWEDEDEVPIEVFDDDSTDNEPTDQLDTVRIQVELNTIHYMKILYELVGI